MSIETRRAPCNRSKTTLIMSILAWIVVDPIAGWLAERITGHNHGLLTNLIVGIIGAVVGGFLISSLLGFRYEEGLNLQSIVVATVGAVALLALTDRRVPLAPYFAITWNGLLACGPRHHHLRRPEGGQVDARQVPRSVA